MESSRRNGCTAATRSARGRFFLGVMASIVGLTPVVTKASAATDNICYLDEAGNRQCGPIEVVGTPSEPPTNLGTIVVKGVGEWPGQIFGGFGDVASGIDRGGHFAGNPGHVASCAADASTEMCNSTTGNAGAGNPILFASGNKVESELDFTTSGELPLFLERKYSAHWTERGLFGHNWISNFDLRLSVSTDESVITAYRPDARRVRYVYATTPSAAWYETKGDPVSRIVRDSAGNFTLHTDNDGTERYDSQGRIASLTNQHGVGITFSYTNGQLTRATHTSGRVVQFAWTDGYVTSVVDPAGNTWRFEYASRPYGQLKWMSAVVKPGSPTTTHQYHYELPQRSGALTGKSINGARYATFTYNDWGWANSSEHAGGVERHVFAYTQDGSGGLTTVHTNPLGKQTTYVYQSRKLQSITGHPSANCPATQASQVTYDQHGYRDKTTGFAGQVTDFDYNAKGQLLQRTEAAGTAAARVMRYTWDSKANRILQETLVGLRETHYAYRSDGRLASVSVKNLSANGTPGQVRNTLYAYTFHANGMLASTTVDGPLPGDTIVTTYSAAGDLLQVRNAAGHATTFSAHNALGQPGRVTSPAGAISEYVYDARGRVVIERTFPSGAAVETRYVYGASGLLDAVQHTDGNTVLYHYDAARRLIQEDRTEPDGSFAVRRITYNALSLPTKVEVGRDP